MANGLSEEHRAKLDGIVQQMTSEGESDANIQFVVDDFKSKYEGKTGGSETGDAAAIDGGASSSEDGSSELTPEQAEEKRATNEAAYRASHATLPGAASLVAHLPDFLLEPYAAFEGTLLGFGSGVQKFATQQSARWDKDKYNIEDGQLVKSEDGSGETVIDLLEEATPKDRMSLWESYSDAGDNIQEAADVAHGLAEQRGTGSITKELLAGNFANAAQLTANQTAGGLASLVPFMVPGGGILGPAVLGSSATAGSFEEDLEDVDKTGDATIDQIYNASYLKGGAEFATEFVTAGILGRAKKMASAGASVEAVKEYTKSATRRVLGDAFAEGISEGLTDTVGRFVDNQIYGAEVDKDEAIVGFLDSAIVGAIVGGKVSTFGQSAAKENAKKLAANALKSPEQKQASQERAETVQKAQDKIDELKAQETELSLVQQAQLNAAETAKSDAIQEEIASEKKHQETFDDMTHEELKEVAENTDKANKLEEAKKEIDKKNEVLVEEGRDAEVEDTAVIEDAIRDARSKAATAYNTVASWQETTRDIDAVVKNNQDKVKEIEQEESNIALEEKQAAKAEQPNPVGTQKRKQRKQKLNEQKKAVQENITQLEKVKDQARPTTADA